MISNSILRIPLLAPLFLFVASCSNHSLNVHKHVIGEHFPGDKSVASHKTNNDGLLKVISLNLAHGRKDALNQIFLSKSTIKNNLSEIAQVIKTHNADIIALQEADGPSWWSGSFDHVQMLARESGYPWYDRADHASNWLFTFGTAVLSRWPVVETIQHRFKPSPPTLNKGYLLSRIKWEPEPDQIIDIDIVSVHLDFSRKAVRQNQIRELSDTLLHRTNPMIIMGDFNSEWFANESVVKRLVDKGKMKVYAPSDQNLNTYKNKKRLDWILVTNELEFTRYEILNDTLSDHRAILAELKLVNNK